MRRIRHLACAGIIAGCGHHAATPADADPGADAAAAVVDAADPAAGENVELKADLADPAGALATLALDDTNTDTVQDVWFYDTHELALYDAGAILRARKVHNGNDDSTVKARPLDVSQVPAAWLAQPGAKCEVDRMPDHAASACSLTEDVAHGTIDAVATGGAIASIYTADQLVFLGSVAGPVDVDSLLRLGPIASTVWKLTPSDLPAALSLERWVLGDGETILEVSMRVPHPEADADLDALLAWLATRGIALAPEQDSKTRAALAAYTQ